MLKIMENITKKTCEAQNKQLRFFAKIDITTKLKILKQQKSLFYKLKSTYVEIDNAILTLASLILAIDSIAKGIDYVNLNAIKIRAKNNKAKVKRQKLLAMWAIVKTLKVEQNMSFRDISKYLKKYHKFEISHSSIQKTWNQLKNMGEKYEE